MADLWDMMRGAAADGEKRFADDPFAEEFGGVVTRRVRRRRTVSAAAYGGGTALAIGAVVVAAIQLPGVGDVGPAVSPPASGCVDDGTSTTDWTVVEPEEDASRVINVVGPERTSTLTLRLVAGEGLLVEDDSGREMSASRLERATGEYYEFATLGDGVPVLVRVVPGELAVAVGEPGWAVVYDAAGVPTFGDPFCAVSEVSATATASASCYWFTPEPLRQFATDQDGWVMGRSQQDGDDLLLWADGKLWRITPNDAHQYVFEDAEGSHTLNAVEYAATADDDGSTPEWLCEQPAVTSPTLGPAAAWNANEPSPFQCGVPITSTERAIDEIAVQEPRWVPPAEAQRALDALYASGDSGIDVPPDGQVLTVTARVGDLITPVGSNGAHFGGQVGWIDPADPDYGSVEDSYPENANWMTLGLSVVAVRDSQVVATVPPIYPANATIEVRAIPPESTPYGITFVDPWSALEPCPGTDGVGDLYVVAGVAARDGADAYAGPFYAWAKLDPAP